MLTAIQNILGSASSASYIQYTASVCTIVVFVVIARAICRMFDI